MGPNGLIVWIIVTVVKLFQSLYHLLVLCQHTYFLYKEHEFVCIAHHFPILVAVSIKNPIGMDIALCALVISRTMGPI